MKSRHFQSVEREASTYPHCRLEDLDSAMLVSELLKLSFYSDKFLRDEFFGELFRERTESQGLDKTMSQAPSKKTSKYRRRLNSSYKVDPMRTKDISTHARVFDEFTRLLRGLFS